MSNYNISLKKMLIIQLIIAIIFCVLFKINFVIVFLLIDLAVLVGVFLLKNDFILISLTIISSIINIYVTENLGLPDSSKLIVDYLIFLISIKLFTYFITKKIKFRFIYIPIFIFTFLSFVSFILNSENLITFLIAIYRNYLRYFIILISVINFDLPRRKIIKFIRLLGIILFLQVPMVIFQDYWSENHWIAKLPGDIRQDYLAGIMGGRGSAQLGGYILLAFAIFFILYKNKKIKFIYLIISYILFSTMLIIGEIKFVFIVVPILLLFLALKKLKLKYIIIVVITTIILVIGINELGKIYPWFNNFLNIDSIVETINFKYAGSGLSRGDSFIVATKTISKNIANILLGCGADNNILIDSYAVENYKFTMFTISQYIVEVGYLGLATIFSIYTFVIKCSKYLGVYSNNDFDKILGQTGLSLILILILLLFYSSNLVTTNFAIFAWAYMGLIIREYYLTIPR